ncbi:MAG TPA: hypothetical protein PKV84_04225, partial [Candidatus Omnitrophota bacterium]|nr:hypothetical protein [Candidatus Omnitrophota bacterium]
AVGVAMLIACYALIIQPVFKNVTALRQEVFDSQKRLDLYQEIEISKGSLRDLESSLVTMKDRSLFLGKISDLASQSQLNVQTLTPRTQAEGDYSKLSVELEGKGSFFALLKFLKALEGGGISLSIKSISLLRQSSLRKEEEKYPLQIQIDMGTILKSQAKKTND